MSDVRAKPIEWLWQDKLVKGVSMIMGVGGRGKSQLTIKLGADLVNGTLPGTFPENGNIGVVYMSAEDPSDMIVKPRLVAAGLTDDQLRNNIYEVSVKANTFLLPNDIPRLVGLVENIKNEKQFSEVVVFIDPVRSFVHPDINTNEETAVRTSILLPLERACRKYDFSVVFIDHMNKRGDSSSADARTMGAGFYNAIRSQLIFGRKPETDIGEGLRAIAQSKGNWAPSTKTIIAQVMEKKDLIVDGVYVGNVPYLQFIEETDEIDAEDIIEADTPKLGTKRGGGMTKQEIVQRAAISFLQGAGGEADATFLNAHCKRMADCNKRTVQTAIAAIPGIIGKDEPVPGAYRWRLLEDWEVPW